MCGISAVLSTDRRNIISYLYSSLFHIQHRGQDAFGLSTYDSKYHTIKGKGLLSNITDCNENILPGSMGIGHVRYPTAGLNTEKEIQPFNLNKPHGISIAHNGNIHNKQEISNILKDIHNVHLTSTSDTELILYLFSIYLDKELKYQALSDNVVCSVIKTISKLLNGSYSIVMMIYGYGIVCFKDPHGIRPLCYDYRDGLFVASSESVSLHNLNMSDTELGSGEIVIMKNTGSLSKYTYDSSPCTPCIFEWIYISRLESILYNTSVYEARYNMGEILANRIKESLKDIDYIIPVPDTSKPCAQAISDKLQIPYKEAIIKNRYIHRTFIMDTNQTRTKNIKNKLNVIPKLVQDKTILLVDDSIVRGNTMKHIISLVKSNGARKVYVASCSPMIKYPNYYGVDVPTKEELIAHDKTINQIESNLGADKLIYQDLNDLIEMMKKLNPSIHNYECSLFTGEYL